MIAPNYLLAFCCSLPASGAPETCMGEVSARRASFAEPIIATPDQVCGFRVEYVRDCLQSFDVQRGVVTWGPCPEENP